MRNLILIMALLFYISVASQTTNCNEITWENGLPDFTDAKIAFIDFDNQKCCKISLEDEEKLILDGFTEIKSRFNNKGFSIYIDIRRRPYKFQFDANYRDCFSMAFNNKIPFINETHQIVEDNTTDFVYNNKWITVNGIHYSSAITISEKEKKSRVGMAFIKGFNWIVDFRHNKVYIKKNSIGLETQNTFTKTYQVKIIDNSLVITSRNSRFKQYSVGDVISTVNGIQVTPQNISEFADMLSAANDWDAIIIDVTGRNMTDK